MARLVALALALIGGCGRLDFAPLDDAGAGVSDAFDACAIRSIAVGERHICALRNDGTIVCAGDNVDGQLGTGVLSAPQPTPVLATEWTQLGAPVASVDAGRQNTGVRDSNGTLFGVGANGNRQLGTITVGAAPSPTRLAAELPALRTVAFGNAFGCGITPGNEVYCWGDSDEGQGGLGTSPNGHAPELIAVLTAQMPMRVSTGTNHVCAILAGPNLACWGDGGLFRLGYVATDSCPNASAGPISCQTRPAIVPLAGVMAVAAGHEHTCAAITDGSLRCWGSNDRSQIGQPPSTSTAIIPVAGVSNVVEVAAGRHFNCARDAMGRVWCWGAADLGQLGSTIGAPESATPLEVVLPRPATSLVTHALGNSTCAILDDGTVSCWGANDFGQLGRGTMTAFELPAQFMRSCD